MLAQMTMCPQPQMQGSGWAGLVLRGKPVGGGGGVCAPQGLVGRLWRTTYSPQPPCQRGGPRDNPSGSPGFASSHSGGKTSTHPEGPCLGAEGGAGAPALGAPGAQGLPLCPGGKPEVGRRVPPLTGPSPLPLPQT